MRNLLAKLSRVQKAILVQAFETIIDDDAWRQGASSFHDAPGAVDTEHGPAILWRQRCSVFGGGPLFNKRSHFWGSEPRTALRAACSLEMRGLVMRLRDPCGERTKYLVLTDFGRSHAIRLIAGGQTGTARGKRADAMRSLNSLSKTVH